MQIAAGGFMRDTVVVTGMILKAFDFSEFDRRLIMLTADRGKITVFAKGVRRQGAKFMAASDQFVFGRFMLFEGKSAYNLYDAEVTSYFEELRTDMECMCYASYFADIADYYTRENDDDAQMLKLLYRAIQALLTDTIDNRIVRAVYELKSIAVNGEYPGAPRGTRLLPGTENALSYIESADIKELYSFRVSDEVRDELASVATAYRVRYMQTDFKSLEVMSKMGYNISP